MERRLTRREFGKVALTGATIGGSVAIAYGAGYINGVTEAGRLFLAFLNSRRSETSQTTVPIPLDNEERIKEAQRIWQQNVSRDRFLFFLPQMVLDENGIIAEEVGAVFDIAGKPLQDQSDYLSLRFPPSTESKNLIFPSPVEGEIIQAEKFRAIPVLPERGHYVEVKIKVGEQIWGAQLLAKDGEPMTEQGKQVSLGEPLFSMDMQGYTVVDSTYPGQTHYDGAKIRLTAWVPNEHHSTKSNLTKRSIFRDFKGGYYTIPVWKRPEIRTA